MALSPRIQATVHQRRGDDVGPVGEGSAEVVDAAAAVDHVHALTHQLLLQVGGAEVIQLLAPQVDLVAKVHLRWADGLTAVAERAGADVARVLLRVAQHAEVDADRTWDEVAVGVAATTTIDGAGVHARTTTDALQCLPVLWIADPLRAAVIHQNDVHRMGCRTSLAEVRGKGCRRLSCASSAEHALEHGQTVVVGDDLLQTDGCDVQLGAGGRHIGITLVGAHHDITCLCDTEVAACHTCVGRQELIPQAQSGHIGQIGGVVVALLAAELFLEELAHVIVVQVDGGHHDMAGCLTLQLDDALAKVRLYHFNAMLLQVGVHAALFSQHRLRLDHLLHVVVL